MLPLWCCNGNVSHAETGYSAKLILLYNIHVAVLLPLDSEEEFLVLHIPSLVPKTNFQSGYFYHAYSELANQITDSQVNK